MFNPSKLLAATQALWPLRSSLTLVRIADTLPEWAAAAAQRVAVGMHPAEVIVTRVQLTRLADQYAALYRRWVVAAVLAVLLALAVVASAASTPLDSLHLGILSGVLVAILLPPMVICDGIARDYIAARALATVLAGIAK